uniref:Secreted protein n=1 Tax=Steinernema glaseri TaxID=37863 RepID=A0A1I7ZJT3_9BILA
MKATLKTLENALAIVILAPRWNRSNPFVLRNTGISGRTNPKIIDILCLHCLPIHNNDCLVRVCFPRIGDYQMIPSNGEGLDLRGFMIFGRADL